MEKLKNAIGMCAYRNIQKFRSIVDISNFYSVACWINILLCGGFGLTVQKIIRKKKSTNSKSVSISEFKSTALSAHTHKKADTKKKWILPILHLTSPRQSSMWIYAIYAFSLHARWNGFGFFFQTLLYFLVDWTHNNVEVI